MNCDKCKNKHWKECCNDCKELEYCCYICEDIVKVKDYIKHLGTIMPIQINIWSVIFVKFISIFLSLGLEMEVADFASNLTDIDLAI